MSSFANFYEISHFLPILNGSILADLIVLFILYYTPYFESKELKTWYEKYRLSAVIADVLILVIGILITKFIFTFFHLNFNVITFLFVLLFVQVIHDVSFFMFFTSIPRKVNNMLDLFKDYADEVSYKAILGDSFMLVIAFLASYYFTTFNLHSNLLILIGLVYLIPYIIYTK